MHSPVQKLNTHSTTVLRALAARKTPATAYELLASLKGTAIKAPPTIYRALESLVTAGYIHKIESLNAYIACNAHGHAVHSAYFAVCDSCQSVQELHDKTIAAAIITAAKKLRFHVKHEMLELLGTCKQCQKAS